MSGGIDSSLITAMMQRIYNNKVQSFTIGFENMIMMKRNRLGKLQNILKQTTPSYTKPQDLIDVIDKLPEVYSEPFADSSQIPTVILSGLTKIR